MSPAVLDLLDRWRGRPVADPATVRARLLAIAGLDPPEPASAPATPSVGATTTGRPVPAPAPTGPPASRDPAGPAVRALVVVGVLAVVVAAVAVWRAQGGEVAPVTLAPGTSVVPSGPSAAPAAPAFLVVQVLGEVRRPGVVRVPSGARVVDAIAAAGGLRRGGSSGLLNLARRLTDGEQVVVGPDAVAGPTPGASGSGPAGGLVDLNTADEAALDTLPGVGPVTASAIVAWRDDNGGFTSVEQLREVDGIGPKTYEQLAPLVTVGSG